MHRLQELATGISYAWVRRKIPLIAVLGTIFNGCAYMLLMGHISIVPYKFRQPLPLILLYTHNRTAKTRDNICRGISNGGHVVNFDRCPKKCEFSCRINDFKNRSPQAILFFGEDFYWPFPISDINRISTKQRWIFWSWEAPIHHHEYTKRKLKFNWYVRNGLNFDNLYVWVI